jgi:hypothetical protein
MVDTKTALAGSALLATAAGALLEDAAPEALRPSGADPQLVAARLIQVGEDVIVLARAMGVLHRRAADGAAE